MSASSPVQGPGLSLTPAPRAERPRFELRGHELAPGCTVRYASLEFDGAPAHAGLEQLRPLSSRLLRLELELTSARFEASGWARAETEGDRLELELEKGGGLLLARAAFGPGPLPSLEVGPRALVVDLGEVVGTGERASLESAAMRALEEVFGGEAQLWQDHRLAVLEPLGGWLRLGFPKSGFKLPDPTALRLRSVTVFAGGLRLNFEPGLAVEAASLGEARSWLETGTEAETAGWVPTEAPALVDLSGRLRAAGERRRPARLAWAAAQLLPAGPERLRRLEEAVALRPSDARPMAALFELQASLGRSSAAIRTARRWVSAERSAEGQAQAHVAAAGLLARSGDRTGAIREVRRALEAHPRSVEAARAAFELGERDLALEGLRVAAAEGDPEAILGLGEAQLAAGRNEAAADAAREVLALRPTDQRACTLLLQSGAEPGPLVEAALREAERSGGALGAAALEWCLAHAELVRAGPLLAAAEAPPERWSAWFQTLRSLEEVEGKAGLLAGVAERAPTADIALPAASLALELGHPAAELRSLVHDWVKQAPEKRASAQLLTDLARSLGEPEALVEALTLQLAAESGEAERAELFAELARAHRSAGRPLAAVRALEEALKLTPERVDWLERLVDLHRARDDRARLAEVLGRLARVGPEDRRAERGVERARILAALGEDEPAYVAVRQAIEGGDAGSMAQSLATVLALRLGRYEEARKWAEARLLELADHPADARLPVWVDLARIAEALDQPDALVSALREALAVADPSTGVGRELTLRLERALEHAGDEEAALGLAERAGRDERRTPVDRARWLTRAGEGYAELAKWAEAAEVAEAALGLEPPAASGLRERALAVLERAARSSGDPNRIAAALGARLEELAGRPEARGVMLERVEALVEAERSEEALSACESAVHAFPDSLAVLARFAGLVEHSGDQLRAAHAFARAAALAERDAHAPLAAGLHARAAAAFVAADQPDHAEVHDEAVLASARATGRGFEDAAQSLQRLKLRAADREDRGLLRRVLEAELDVGEPSRRARVLEELADLLVAMDRLDEAIGCLERRIELSQDGGEAILFEERLDQLRADAGRPEERARALERRARAASSDEAARLWIRAARLRADELSDLDKAVRWVEAALAAVPDHPEARAMRVELARKSPDPLVRAATLEEEGGRASSAAAAAELFMEAARALLEVDEHRAVWRALDLSKRAAAALPRDAEPLRLAVRAARRLDGHQPELSLLLGQLVQRTERPEEALACRMRRAELLDQHFRNPTSALGELEHLLEAPSGLREVAVAMVDAGRPEAEVLAWASRLARAAELPERELRYLQRWAGVAPDPSPVIARQAELLEEIGDHDGAEEAWGRLLSLDGRSEAARDGLTRCLVQRGAFERLAEVLGLDVLRKVARRRAEASSFEASAVLWRRLEPGEERDRVLAELPETALELEERRQGWRELGASDRAGARSALRRLASLEASDGQLAEAARIEMSLGERWPDARIEAFLAGARYWLDADQPSRAEAALEQAGAEALESDEGRSVGARVYAALDRFEQLAELAGVEAVAESARAWLVDPATVERGMRAAEVWAGRDGSGRTWMEVAGLLGEAGLEGLETKALERASECEPSRDEAWLRMAERARSAGDLEKNASALEQWAAGGPEDGAGRRERLLVLGAAQRELAEDGGPESAWARAEQALLEARAIESDVDVEALLVELWVLRGRLERIGEELGGRRLLQAASDAEASGDGETALELLRVALGHDEPEVSLEAADRLERIASERGDLELELQALSRRWLLEPDGSAKARLRDRLGETARFDVLLDRLGTEALAEWLEAHRASDRFVEGARVLARQWQSQADIDSDRVAELWADIGERLRADGDVEGAEEGLRSALTLSPRSERARTGLVELLAETRRYEALAEVDASRLEAMAESCADAEQLAPMLRALGGRLVGTARARPLLRLAGMAEFQERRSLLSAALEADPACPGLREALAEHAWTSEDPRFLIRGLGIEAFFEEVERRAAEAPAQAVHFAETGRSLLEARQGARLSELEASIHDPEAEEGEDQARRRDALLAARFVWDQAADAEGGARVRLALVELLKEGGQRDQLLDALVDAWDAVRDPEARSKVGLELGRRLSERRPSSAGPVFRALVEGPEFPASARQEAARGLFDHFLDQGDEDPLLAESALEGLELLVRADKLEDEDWLWLAELREAAGRSPSEVDAALAAAAKCPGADGEALLRRRLAIWDREGDWERAAPIAKALADTTGASADRLALAEVLRWTGELDEASRVCRAVLEGAPSDDEALELAVEVDEERGALQAAAELLLAGVDARAELEAEVRSSHAWRAHTLAVEAGQVELAARAAERAIEVGGDDADFERAEAYLRDLPDERDRRIKVLRAAPAHAIWARVALVEALEAEGDREQALTVLERAVSTARSADSELLALVRKPDFVPPNRLLRWADGASHPELGAELRAIAARSAESEGDLELARSAWTSTLSSLPGSSEEARQGILRVARASGDVEAVVAALEEAAEEATGAKAAAESWREAALVAEVELGSVERAAAILDRGARTLKDRDLEAAFLDLHERNEAWAALDAWLDRRRVATEGEARAKFAARRAELRARRFSDTELAIELYRESIALAPDAEVELALVRCLLEAGQNDQAAALAGPLAAKLEGEAGRSELHRLRMSALEAAGRLDEAAAVAALAARDGDVQAEDARLRYLARLGDDEALVRALISTDAPVAEPWRSERLLAAAHLVRGDAGRVRELLERITAEATRCTRLEAARLGLELGFVEMPGRLLEVADGPEGAALLAEATLAQGRVSEARERLEGEGQQEPRAWRTLARCSAAEGQLDEAEQLYARWANWISRRDPLQAAETWMEAARTRAERGELESALALARRARDGGIDGAITEVSSACTDRMAVARWQLEQARLPTEWRAAAEALEACGDIVRARRAEAEAVLAQLDSAEPEALERAADELERAERWDALVEVLERRLEHASRKRPWRIRLIRAALKADRLDRARSALESEPNALDLRLELAVAAERSGAFPQAAADYSAIAGSDDPSSRRKALFGLARCRGRASDPEGAMDALESALGDAEWSRAAVERHDVWAALAGTPDRAARVWARLATRSGSRTRGLTRAAELRWEAGERRGALAALGMVLRRSPRDIGAAWLALETRLDFGDPDGAAEAGRAAAEFAPPMARSALLLEVARQVATPAAWEEALLAAAGTALEGAVQEHARAAAAEVEGLEVLLEARGVEELPRASVMAPDLDPERRSELDLGGRWTELAELEAALTEAMLDPRERSAGWLRVAGIRAKVEEPNARYQERLALEQALDADPAWTRPVAVALEDALADGRNEPARALVERAAALGGLPWPAPRFELLAADAWAGEADRERGWLEAALERDPESIEALARLAELELSEGRNESATALIERWGRLLDEVVDPERSERQRTAWAKLQVALGFPEKALERLDPTRSSDAEVLSTVLTGGEGTEGARSRAFLTLYRARKDVRGLVEAARLGEHLDEIEALAWTLSPPRADLDRALVEQRVAKGEGRSILRWLERRGDGVLADLPSEARWCAARAALAEDEIHWLPRLLASDDGVEGLSEVFGERPLRRVLRHLQPRERELDRMLVQRLRSFRPADYAVVETWLERGPTAGSDTVEDLRRFVHRNPHHIGALERLVELDESGRQPGPVMLLAWFRDARALEESGASRPAGGGILALRHRPMGPFTPLALEPVPGLEVRVDEGAGTQAGRGEDGTVFLGRGLVATASEAELRFHVARSSLDEWGAVLRVCGSLDAAITGVSRGRWWSWAGPRRESRVRRSWLLANVPEIQALARAALDWRAQDGD